ncbi:MAG: cytochrome C [Planctomycetaceae bacterium]|nr:cytochrome C [Planctomycetaceae bacterium]
MATYVGHQKCAECHSDIVETHLNSPHANTFATTKESEVAQRLCRKQIELDEVYGTYHYQCDEAGVTVSIPEKFGGKLFPLDYALGSGKHATTLITLMLDAQQETINVEHRLTWYAEDETWDITPGQENDFPTQPGDYFGHTFRQPNVDRCIGCHTTTVDVVGRKLENLYANVQCEACHGPGSLHVAAAERGDEDLHLFLKSRWSAEAQIKMCGECHRNPDSIEPDRLKRYPNSLVRFQPVGLLQSPCFLKSNGALSCTTCHDSHTGIESRSHEQQIQTCLSCHQDANQVHCPVSPAGNCIECHMPAIDLVKGLQFHDHWIRVRRDQYDSPTEARPQPSKSIGGEDDD